MAVKLRLKRTGRRHLPCYRLNAIDSRAPRDGRVIEELGGDSLHAAALPWVFLENVPALEDNEGFGVILSDLHALGYRTASVVVDAFAVGAPHGRSRLFVLADPHGAGRTSFAQRDLQPNSWSGVSPPRWLDSDRRALFPPRTGRVGDWAQWPATARPHLHRDAAGTAGRVDRLHLTGNAVVPLVAAYALCHLWAALSGARVKQNT